MAKFELDDDEVSTFVQWDKDHVALQHEGEEPYSGVIGGRISFIVTVTSLGQIVSAECALCKAKNKERDDYKKCLTNFDNW